MRRVPVRTCVRGNQTGKGRAPSTSSVHLNWSSSFSFTNFFHLRMFIQLQPPQVFSAYTYIRVCLEMAHCIFVYQEFFIVQKLEVQLRQCLDVKGCCCHQQCAASTPMVRSIATRSLKKFEWNSQTLIALKTEASGEKLRLFGMYLQTTSEESNYMLHSFVFIQKQTLVCFVVTGPSFYPHLKRCKLQLRRWHSTVQNVLKI